MIGLAGATLAYAAACVTIRLGGSGILWVIAGFCTQGVFLWYRTLENHSLPIHSTFEQLTVISWLLAGWYLMFGRGYRRAMAGRVSIFLATLILLAALCGPFDRSPKLRLVLDERLQMHLPALLVALTAFGYACVVAGIYMIQEDYLRRTNRPAGTLAGEERAHLRLLLMGLLALSVAILTKVTAFGGMLVVLGGASVGLLLFRHLGVLHPKAVILGAAGIYLAGWVGWAVYLVSVGGAL